MTFTRNTLRNPGQTRGRRARAGPLRSLRPKPPAIEASPRGLVTSGDRPEPRRRGRGAAAGPGVAGLDHELDQHVGGEARDREARPVAEGLEQRGIEAGAASQRHRLAGEEPAERPLAAAPLDAAVPRVAGDPVEAGVERRPRAFEHLGEPAVEEDQPAGEPRRRLPACAVRMMS